MQLRLKNCFALNVGADVVIHAQLEPTPLAFTIFCVVFSDMRTTQARHYQFRRHLTSAHQYPRTSDPPILFEHTSHTLSSFDRISRTINIVERTSHPTLSVDNTSLPLVSVAQQLTVIHFQLVNCVANNAFYKIAFSI